MKRYIKLIGIILFWYLVGVIYQVSFNLADWSLGTRGFLLVLLIASIVVTIFIDEVDCDAKSRDLEKRLRRYEDTEDKR